MSSSLSLLNIEIFVFEISFQVLFEKAISFFTIHRDEGGRVAANTNKRCGELVLQ